MAISVDYTVTPWLITLPKSDLTLDIGTKYKLTVDVFWQLLRDYADSPEGIVSPVIYSRISATSSTPSITEVNEDYYELQFEDGLYSVNIINGNTNIRDVEVKNQVSVNTNNTTGFIDPIFLNHGTFNDVITIDVANGISGTDYPAGTPSSPSNNLTDTKAISNIYGIKVIHIIGNLTIGAAENIDNYVVQAVSSNSTILDLTAGSSTTNTVFKNLCIKGDLNGTTMRFENVDLHPDGVTGLQGEAHNLGYAGAGPYVLGGVFTIVRSFTIRAESILRPVLDVNGHASCAIRGHAGPFEVTGITDANSIVCIDVLSGLCVLQAGNTDGTVALRDGMKISDNSTGTTIADQVTSTRVWEESAALSLPKYLGLK